MDKVNRFSKIAGGVFIGISIVFMLVYSLSDRKINLALPLVFIMLGLAFLILVYVFLPQWSWAVFLFIPGTVLLAFGLIFLLNVLTGDWKSWAYAWLFLIAAAALGVWMAARYAHWQREVSVISIGAIVLSITLFFIFGLITGGPVSAITALILLLLVGLALFRLSPERFLPESLLHRLGAAPQETVPSSSVLDPAAADSGAGKPAALEPSHTPAQAESLSPREIEVLRLIERGLSNQEIAVTLTLAPSTVKTHINNIYGKLGVETRVQAINRARELGILPHL